MPSYADQNTRWFALGTAEVFSRLGSSERGLGVGEAARRLGAIGPNKLPEAKAKGWPTIFVSQFQSPLIYILLAASAVVFYLGEYTDGFIILFVLFFNAVVGTVQEGRSQNTLAALKKFTTTSAVVLRDGHEFVVPDFDLVPGDVILLQEGEKVPADARVTLSINLRLDEAALTGESVPVHKIVSLPRLKTETGFPLAEQKNMVFKGTYVLLGSGKAVVTATGGDTAIGRISKIISAIDTEIPLRANIRYLSRLIILAVGTISSTILVSGLILDKPFTEMFTTVVALSVSIIPEGLPVVLSVVLALGVWRMSKRNALIKRLQAVEALGQSRLIAVDKTGTITKNEMVIQKIYSGGKTFMVTGSGYEPKGDLLFVKANEIGRVVVPADSAELLFAGRVASFASSAHLSFLEETGGWRVSGDPTEAAMQVLGEKIGFPKSDVDRAHPIVSELPFDYRTKIHAVMRRVDGRRLLAVVGAPEKVLDLCGTVWEEGRAKAMTGDLRAKLAAMFEAMSGEGLRVLAFAVNEDPPAPIDPNKLPPLSFGGFYGMKDALRPEVASAVATAQKAGVKVIMITGDHRLTAEAIAREAGILDKSSEVVTGDDLDRISDEELVAKIRRVSVFARVTPEHKLRIIQAYRRGGEIVAMTGDGVNDAPSLVAADLGVAMGKIGTEVAKEAADIVILDDNFSSVVAAIEEGRGIYKTIQKVILYLFSTSLGEVFTIAGALFLGMPLPILAGQILWLNLVTDGFLDVALAAEPNERGLLDKKFEKPKKYIVDSLMAERMIFMAIPMMVGALILFSRYYPDNLAKGWTVSLTVLAVFQWFNAWNCRSEDKSIFQMNPLVNKFLIGATATIILLQLAAVYTAPMQRILHTVPLSLYDWAVIVPVALSIVAVEEARKFVYRRVIRVHT